MWYYLILFDTLCDTIWYYRISIIVSDSNTIISDSDTVTISDTVTLKNTHLALSDTVRYTWRNRYVGYTAQPRLIRLSVHLSVRLYLPAD